MAVITSAVTGNFSAPATWVGGVVPTSVDDAVAATGTVVTIDTDVTVISFQQAGTGKFVLGNGRTVTGNVIANAGTFTSGGTVECIATTSATINGNLTGVSSTAVNIAGVVMTGSGTLTVNGSITGSAGNATSQVNGHAGLYTNVVCSLNINGNITAGTGEFKYGVWGGVSSNGTVNVIGNLNSIGQTSHGLRVDGTSAIVIITGNVNGGGAAGGYGAFMTGSSASLTITGNVTSTGTGNSVGGVRVEGASAVVTVTGNASGGTANNAIAVTMTGLSASLTITGNVTGGSGSGAPAGVRMDGASATATITGNVTGGSSATAYGVSTIGGSTILTITGNVTGGGGSSAFGAYASGLSSTVTIIGSVTGVSTLIHGVRSDATANGVILQGNLTDSLQGATAIYSRLLRLTATNNGTTTYTNTVGYPNGVPVTRVSPNLVTGMPATTNVRNATVYGFNNELTGTMKVPPAGSVALGVPVDTSTGTAALDVGSVVAVVGAQVAAASSNPSVV